MHTQALPRPLAPQPKPQRQPRGNTQQPAPAPPLGDATIRRTVLERFAAQPWWDAAHANVFVDGGTVVLQGLASGRAARAAARQLALAVNGVRGVWDARVPRREWQALA
jgi:hypothetical protein